MSGLQETPAAQRLHIALYGRRNAGKSSLINALTGQQVALVSPVAGTTADPVKKAMELHPIGPVLFIDTAGYDDEGELGQLRVEATRDTLTRADVALLVIAGEPSQEDLQWAQQLREKNTPFLVVQTKGDLAAPAQLPPDLAQRAVAVSAATGEGIEALQAALTALVPEDFGRQDLTRGLCSAGDVVLLVMPQDIQAPKGRLILPQVRTIRHLLDLKCTVVSTTADGLDGALAALSAPPKLIITDSQCFPLVAAKKPGESLLTSFSILMAADKGDIDAFAQGAKAIGTLHEHSRVLIAEGCTHAPLEEDIGRVKIPNLLRKRVGQGLQVDVVAGNDFPHDLTGYDLVIHCGGCMFNRAYVLSRLAQAQGQGVPMTNYGVAIAYLTGILNQVSW
ncbi:[FeFe] hydrogenase H-cluster maturation GTPase HydF [Pseudoflavonifractor sp. An176]|uniref:[FeFe] hydrogenase H-cluster maturation GTPase HydF n=1 Tax=Pseudoflavonifractor sp. An176 TaxID=1965572 RepID=UPI000B3AFE47|nr:[FeFe] hydrogenase H-cluster maturation GTPase HydF [Pseudoflavonifractor sp. An176]OUP63889.1 [FeFe] hydrogenase H-cluster maturation GTPase HydF [Pseudoflavonifractor sp. An176]